jgi:hypothetical protein
VKTLLLVALLPACSWTQFSDLSDTTWAHSQEADSGQTNYGVAVAGATTSDPGLLAVVSGGPPNYSTLGFDAGGGVSETFSESLGDFSINALSSHPLLISDDQGNVAFIDKGIDGPLVVAHGPAGHLTQSQLSSTSLADAAVFAGANIIVTSVAIPPSMTAPNASFVADTVSNCLITSSDGTTLVAVAAAVVDGTTMWVYTREGVVTSYDTSQFSASTCTTTQTPPAIKASSSAAMTLAPAANGGFIGLVGSPAKFAIVVAFDSPSSSTGAIAVVDLTSMMQVGTAIPAIGAASATYATYGGMATLAVGFPARTVGTSTNVGQVELHAVDDAGGTVDSSPVEVLSVPQADTNLAFGRAVTTMTYNSQPILVVGASNDVYTYFQTSLYANTRQP